MNLDKIREASRIYDEEHKHQTDAERKRLTPRFKALVEKFGASAVSAATDLRESTVIQYMRCKIIPVSEYAVTKAETILSKL